MSKKPLVPVKRPTKGSGKGNHRGLKKLMKEVDSMAKGLNEVNGMKGLKGGVGWLSRGTNKDVKEVVAKDYYDKLRDFFENPENIANIKRLKEGLVNDVLGTMAGGLDVLFNWFKSAEKVEIEKTAIIKFVSIIKDINKLDQSHLNKIINSKNLKGLPYIEKITTLVMIKMLIDVYNSRGVEIINIDDFDFNDELIILIDKIITEFKDNKDNKDNDVLKDLTTDVISFKNINDNINIISQYYNSDGDTDKVLTIVKTLKARRDNVLQRMKELMNKINIKKKRYLNSNNILLYKSFLTISKEIKQKIKNIEDYMIREKEFFGMYNFDKYIDIDNVKNIKRNLKKHQADINAGATSSPNIIYNYKKWYNLYMETLNNEKYITDFLKRELPEVVDEGIEEEIEDNFLLDEEDYSKEEFDEDTPDDVILDTDIELKLKSQKSNDTTTYMKTVGGKLTTKYISTGNFVYILYEKKKIKRCVYTKAKGRGKYCKIKGDYMLLSKLKVV
jgi:hypothetical protein